MNEDKELARFLKKRLEGGVAGEPPRMEEILRAAAAAGAARDAARRSRRWLVGSSLAAATLALTACLAMVCMRPEGPSPESTVEDVIAILCAADGVDSTADGASVVDRLLAWQDAPYVKAVSGAEH